MPDRVCNVLFLCTGNTARSILAEGILRKDGAGRFNAFSGGSQPKGSRQPARDQGARCAGLSHGRIPVEELGRVRQARRSADGFHFHGLRQRRGRGLPDLAWASRDGALGHRGSRRRPGKRDRKGARLRPGRQVPENADFALPQPAPRLARPDRPRLAACARSAMPRARPHAGPRSLEELSDGRDHLPQPGLRHVPQHAGADPQRRDRAAHHRISEDAALAAFC